MTMTNNKKLTIFILIAFLLPLILVIVQSRLTNACISFVLFGIQAASPTISAAIVLGLNKELYSTVAGELRQKNLIKSVAYPLIITCMTMVLSKAIYCFCFSSEFEICQLSVTQFFVVMWALIAEEFGWRGFLEPLLGKMGVHRLLTPCIVGIIWSLWHYHYLLQNKIDAPILWFAIGCIAESYIYSYLMRVTGGNLLSAMIYHFMWNLMLHIVAISPSENNGIIWPYVILTILEGMIASYIIVRAGKRNI